MSESIDKLGLTPIERLNGAGVKPSKLHNFVCVDPVKLTELEEQHREMLKALIGSGITNHWFSINMQRAVEKATGKSWEKIKELL